MPPPGRASLTTLPREIQRQVFRHVGSDADAICLALAARPLYAAYVSTGALKRFDFGARIAALNALRARRVAREVIWLVLRQSGRGAPGYEDEDEDEGGGVGVGGGGGGDSSTESLD